MAIVELADGVTPVETAVLMSDPALTARFDSFLFAAADPLTAREWALFEAVAARPGLALSPLDPDAFAILARNLIKNALLRGREDEAATVTLTADGALSVTNRGPAIPLDTLTGLTAPLAHGATRSAGSGLGFAIAAAVARGAEGRLSLTSPAPGGPDGLKARFTPGAR